MKFISKAGLVRDQKRKQGRSPSLSELPRKPNRNRFGIIVNLNSNIRRWYEIDLCNARFHVALVYTLFVNSSQAIIWLTYSTNIQYILLISFESFICFDFFEIFSVTFFSGSDNFRPIIFLLYRISRWIWFVYETIFYGGISLPLACKLFFY